MIFNVKINSFRKPFIITISDIRIEGECNEQLSLTSTYKRRYSHKDFERYLHWLQVCFRPLFILSSSRFGRYISSVVNQRYNNFDLFSNGQTV